MTAGLPGDALIVRRLREGDETIFGWLMDSWSPLMMRPARHHVSTVQSAEDLVQETWLSVLRGLPRFEGRSSLRTWVFRILLNGQVLRRTRVPDDAVNGGPGRWSRPDRRSRRLT